MSTPREASFDNADGPHEPGTTAAAEHDPFESSEAEAPSPADLVGDANLQDAILPQDIRLGVAGDQYQLDNRREHPPGPSGGARDEVSRANLRRLEATLSDLRREVEAYLLPPAASLPPVRGLPVLGATNTRVATDPVFQSAPPAPIWLQDHGARLVPPPALHEGSRLWPRAMKLLIACAIAAPVSYVLAVATSRFHEQPTEVATIARPAAPILSRQPAVRRAEERNESRQKVVQESALVQRGEPAPEPTVVQPAGPVTTGVAGAEASAAPPSKQALVSAVPAANPEDLKLLIARGKQFVEVGDLVAARILFLRAVTAGDAAAAVAMGETYDPIFLADRGVLGVPANPDKARSWYEHAREMGSQEGGRRLEMLANR